MKDRTVFLKDEKMTEQTIFTKRLKKTFFFSVRSITLNIRVLVRDFRIFCFSEIPNFCSKKRKFP